MQDYPPLTISSPTEMIAAVPALLGFFPAQSIVVVCLKQLDTDSSRVQLAMRVDLPSAASDYAAVACQLASAASRAEASEVIIYVVAAADPDDDRPYSALAEEMLTAFITADLSVLARFWAPTIAAAVPLREYGTRAEYCQTDPRSAAFTAHTVAKGLSLASSRDQLAAELHPTSQADSGERRRRIDALRSKPQDRVQSLDLIQLVINAASDGEVTVEEEQLTRILAALTDHLVRDACMDDTSIGARALWAHLTREAPPPVRADPACLLAAAYYRTGHGARASVALQAAQEATAEHQLMALLTQVIANGFDPELLAGVCASASSCARRACAAPAKGR